jgi:hypothetical protein
VRPVVHSFTAANLDRAELEVFATLHRLKADLGEPVRVTRSSRDVQVEIRQLSIDRQRELRAALGAQPGVRVELTAAPPALKNGARAKAAVPAPPMMSDPPLHEEVDSSNDEQRLLKFFGSAEKEQAFTDRTLATSTALLSHLYALRILLEQFPSEREQALAPQDRVRLAALVQDHAAAVSTKLDALKMQLAPLRADFDVPPRASAANPVITSWQNTSLEALETARLVDHLLRALLTTTRTRAVPGSALPQIDQNLSRLCAELKNLEPAKH